MARKQIRVEVQQRDIDRAVRGVSTHCAVSTAVARAFPDATRIETDSQTIRFTNGEGQRLVYLTPYSVMGYVVAFDAGDPIAPFTFTLRDPIKVRRRVTAPESRPAQAARSAARRAAEKAAVSTTKTPTKKTPKKAAVSTTTEVVKRVNAGEGRAAPPRVFKTKTRNYGSRVMRANRAAGGDS